MRLFWLIFIGCCASMPHAAISQEADVPVRRLVVGTRDVPPFAIKKPDGTWNGLSIDLWREIAAENRWKFELREMGLADLLSAVEKGEVDAAVAAVTVTQEREKLVDFTHPFYSSGLGIAVRKVSRYDWLSGLFHLLAWEFGSVFAFLAAITVVFGVVIWLVERRRNPEHFGSGWNGFGHGIWWAVVTMTTVGYGDKAPKTVLGRAIATLLMFIGIVSLAVITGSVASKMTAARLGTPARGLDDLLHVKTGTVTGTTSESYLREEGIGFRAYSTEIEALRSLINQEIDAVVYDAPTLRYAIHHDLFGAAEVLPVRFQRQDYAIALPPGSLLREPINRALIGIIFQPSWEQTVRRYVGR